VGRAVWREGRPGTASDALAASLTAENKSGIWLVVVSRAMARIINRGRMVTGPAFLAVATKKTPRQSTRLGVY